MLRKVSVVLSMMVLGNLAGELDLVPTTTKSAPPSPGQWVCEVVDGVQVCHWVDDVIR